MAVEDEEGFCTNCNGTGQVKVVSYIRGEAYYKPCPRCDGTGGGKKDDRPRCKLCGTRFRRQNFQYKCTHCKESFCAPHREPNMHDCPKYAPPKPPEKIDDKIVNVELKCYDCGVKFTGNKKPNMCSHCKENFCDRHRKPKYHNCPKYKPPLRKRIKRFYYNHVYSLHMKTLRVPKPLLKYSTLVFLLLALFQPNILIDNSPDEIDTLVQNIGNVKSKSILTTKGILNSIDSIFTGLNFSGGSDTEYIPYETKQLMSSIPKPEYENQYLVELVGMITKDCQSQDSACKTFKIHRYVQENFDYVYIPSKNHLSPAPETMKNKYGVCIDFAILYYNYLMAANVDSYIIDSYGDDHAYAVACDLDLKLIENMWMDASRTWRSQYIIDNNANFEINRIWDKPCIHLEGPPSEKDQYAIDVSYPGEYIEYFIDPETGTKSMLGNERYAIDPKTKRATKVADILLVDSSWKGFKNNVVTLIPNTQIPSSPAPVTPEPDVVPNSGKCGTFVVVDGVTWYKGTSKYNEACGT
jgi:predicted nucleic acid binding AN1-type Zn finger protein